MKIYNKLVIDIASGQVLHEDFVEYVGPVAQASGSKPKASTTSGPAYVIPSILPEIAQSARYSILGPASGQTMRVPIYSATGQQQYEVPQSLEDITMQRAINQIRGGYGARGLAGSGIAAAGEQNAIGQLALQGAQQQAQNVINLLAAGTGQTTTQKQSGGGGLFGK